MSTMSHFTFPDESFSNCSGRPSHSAGMSRSLLLGLIATVLLALVWSGCTTSPDTSATFTAPRVATSENSHAWLEISLPAFEHNVAQVKSLVGPRTQICAVLKADAYGHGISLLMPSL